MGLIKLVLAVYSSDVLIIVELVLLVVGGLFLLNSSGGSLFPGWVCFVGP